MIGIWLNFTHTPKAGLVWVRDHLGRTYMTNAPNSEQHGHWLSYSDLHKFRNIRFAERQLSLVKHPASIEYWTKYLVRERNTPAEI